MVKSMTLAARVLHFHYLEEINFSALAELKEAFKKENKDQSIKAHISSFFNKISLYGLDEIPSFE